MAKQVSAKQAPATAGYDYEEYDSLDDPEVRRSRKPKPKRDSADLMPGVIVRARGHHFDVQMDDERHEQGGAAVRLCEVRGRLLQERGWDTLVAVGDQVWVKPHGRQKGLIERVDERRSVLSRQHPGAPVPAEDVILANPDQVLIVFAVTQPQPHPRMLDRFLVIAEANELPAIICANKVDLVDAAAAHELFGRYAAIGYHVLYASAQSGEGVDDLRSTLAGRLTVLTGPSGVGKSSLLNAVHPDLHLRIGDLREVRDKGKHTTRGAQLFSLPFGERTFVADTPGIRELGLYEIEPANLGFYFVEIAPFVNECRYPDCTHDHEPDCAVRSAVAAGRIFPERYDSYLRLLHGEE